MKRKSSSSSSSSSCDVLNNNLKKISSSSLNKILECAEGLYESNPLVADCIRLQYVFNDNQENPDIIVILDNNPAPIPVGLLKSLRESEDRELIAIANESIDETHQVLEEVKEEQKEGEEQKHLEEQKEEKGLEEEDNDITPPQSFNGNTSIQINDNTYEDMNENDKIHANNKKSPMTKPMITSEDTILNNITNRSPQYAIGSIASQFHPLPNQPPPIPSINYSNSYESQMIDKDSYEVDDDTKDLSIIVMKPSAENNMEIDDDDIMQASAEVTDIMQDNVNSVENSPKDISMLEGIDKEDNVDDNDKRDNDDKDNDDKDNDDKDNDNNDNNKDNDNDNHKSNDKDNDTSVKKTVTFQDKDEIEDWMLEAMATGVNDDIYTSHDDRRNSTTPLKSINEDPLLFSKWPEVIFKRLKLYKPLPLAADILGVSAASRVIIYWAQHTFRIKDNASLNLAILLSKELKIPLLVISLVDEDSYQDVLHNKNQSIGTVAQHSFCRKSFSKIAAIEDFKKSLQNLNIPLLALVTQKHAQTSSIPSSTINVQSEEGSLISSAMQSILSSLHVFALFTDEINHPLRNQIAASIIEKLPKLVYLSIDSSSLVLKEHIATNANIVSDDKDLISCQQNFQSLCREVIKQSSNENLGLVHDRMPEDVQGGLYKEENGTVEIAALKIIVSSNETARIIPVDWPKVLLSLDNYYHKQNLTMMNTYPLCRRWNETTINAYLDELLDQSNNTATLTFINSIKRSWHWEGIGHGVPVIMNALVKDILSPLDLIKRAKQNPKVFEKLLPFIISNEFARFRCSQYKISNPVTGNDTCNIYNIQWLNLLPRNMLISLEDFHKSSSQFSKDPKVIFPAEICQGHSKNKLFNKIQATLVYGGVVPTGYLAQYWILYLISNAVSAELGLKIAIKEVATHSTSLADDNTIIIPTFINDVIDTYIHLIQLSSSIEKHLLFEEAASIIEKKLRSIEGDIEVDAYKNTYV